MTDDVTFTIVGRKNRMSDIVCRNERLLTVFIYNTVVFAEASRRGCIGVNLFFSTGGFSVKVKTI